MAVKVSWVQLTIPDPASLGPGCPPGSIFHTFPPTPFLGSDVFGEAVCPVSSKPAVPETPVIYTWQTSCQL